MPKISEVSVDGLPQQECLLLTDIVKKWPPLTADELKKLPTKDIDIHDWLLIKAWSKSGYFCSVLSKMQTVRYEDGAYGKKGIATTLPLRLYDLYQGKKLGPIVVFEIKHDNHFLPDGEKVPMFVEVPLSKMSEYISGEAYLLAQFIGHAISGKHVFPKEKTFVEPDFTIEESYEDCEEFGLFS